MSKAGAVGRGLYAVLAFLVQSVFRVGLNVSLVASVCMTIYAVGCFSKEALKQRKEANYRGSAEIRNTSVKNGELQTSQFCSYDRSNSDKLK
ncbi:unnamed protein product [Auanema sp. JU1783]|nr:unnamed protein product [Auanema sp. JU1783]